ncbi:Predicted arabinose efflux permease, MFS family [Micromonospora rhizosphaerae]|uniref:Predicted arabinose efflux permease, MFS family n=1 Tax=Micromonospora rhizosphaerae TaxID=568872 RepID=A0A1C6T7U0_9ACTN|nr:MFS transporter [Micromonospora rhizosphaerae]SCL37632.1 Predicted arabinose efflux permease, MFS family [Micromonospora rhizosphaerae]
MSLIRSNIAFRRYWSARLISYAGDQLARTALLIAVYDRYGGTAVALLLLASTAPRLLGPVLGALADRFDQRRLMIGCDLTQALLYLAVALLMPPLPVLLALITAATVAATTFTPAGRSLLPALVGRDRLAPANAQLAVGVNIGFAAGPALGGLLLATAGLTATLLVDVASFLASALLVAGVRRLSDTMPAHRGEPFRKVLHDGLQVVRGNAVTRAVSVGFLVMVTFAALDNLAVVPLGRSELAADEVLVGLLGTAYGVGMVLGPMSLARAGRRARMDLVLYTALLALGVGTLATGFSPVIALALAGQALAGAGAGWHNVAADTLIQQNVPGDRLGVVFGTVYMFPYAAEILAYAVGGALLSALGPRWLLTVSGVGILATLALIAPMLSRALGRWSARRKAPLPVAG